MSLYDSSKQQIVETAQKLTQKGYLMATGGNLSIRIPGQNAFAITPSNYDYMKMVPEDICVLDFGLTLLEGARKPSVETSMHGAIFQVRPDVNAIVHTHQVYASTLALLNRSIPAMFDEQAIFLGRSVKLIPYAPSGTGMLKNTIARHVRDHNNAYIMKNHGALCFGTDAERAEHNVEILEKCALAYLLTLVSGAKATRIPLAIREIAFAKLRKDQKKFEAANLNLELVPESEVS
jgi:L-ribulose-5-phosphate 4-epimerase